MSKGIIVRREFVERNVLGAHKPEFLEVRVCVPPAAALICPDAVCQHLCQSSLGINQSDAFRIRIIHPFDPAFPVLRGEAEGSRNPAAEFVRGQTVFSRISTAAKVAARSMVTKRKSLKWPAWRAAS